MIKLTVNGISHEFDGDPTMPLLWFLRDIIGMKGTKFGCGKALCGACTIHLNGSATRSCVLPMAAVNGGSVTTIEGLSRAADHPVQKAWAQHNVPQCGYCQSGQMMQAADLLARNSNPSDKDIDAHMSGNICRCGTYVRIRQAIKSEAKEVASNSQNPVQYYTFKDSESAGEGELS